MRPGATETGTMNGNPAAVLSAVLLLAAHAIGQQMIFNVPTADVLDRGKVYVELDAAFKPLGSREFGRFSGFVPRIVFGAGGGVELGVNLTGNVQPGPDTTTIVPTAKVRFFEDKRRGVALFAGSHLYIPVRNRS